MPYELFLALRYLYSRRRRPMARVTALVAIAGIAVGVAALIVAMALANGFRDEMRDKILHSTAHVTLMRKDGEPMADWATIATQVKETDGVVSATATTYGGALLSGSAGSAYAVVRGIDPNSATAVEEVRRTLIEGKIEDLFRKQPDGVRNDVKTPAATTDQLGPDLTYSESPAEAVINEAIIGSELAARTGLKPGDIAQIISGDSQLTPLGLAPRFRRMRIAGIFRSDLYEYDASWIYVSLSDAAGLAGAPSGSAAMLSVSVRDIYTANEVAERIRQRLGGEYTTVDWQEANRPLFAALALERRMGLVILGLIIFIATLNITATLVLVVVERRTDIAILTAMGARARNIMLIFMIEGALVGLIGAVTGVVVGLVACVVGDRFRLVSLPADVYSLSNVPFHSRAQDVALAAAVAFLLSLVATIYPAQAAARVRPAEALRDS
jgi:lipoprotein-releasing system permease protein